MLKKEGTIRKLVGPNSQAAQYTCIGKRRIQQFNLIMNTAGFDIKGLLYTFANYKGFYAFVLSKHVFLLMLI